MHGHPVVEDVYEQVKKRMPSISLATVYNNVRQFVECGMLHEVSLHHGSSRLETNTERHFHAVCTACRSIRDIPASYVRSLSCEGGLAGFRMSGFTIEFHGLCELCEFEAFRRERKLRPRRNKRQEQEQESETCLE